MVGMRTTQIYSALLLCSFVLVCLAVLPLGCASGPEPVLAVSVSLALPYCVVGATVTATVTVTSDGAPDPGAAVLLASSDEGVATVSAPAPTDASGKTTATVAGVAPGTATLTATCDATQGSVVVTVTEGEPVVTNAKDDTMRLLLVGGGHSVMGSSDGPYDNERPSFDPNLPAYYLGETEVTNAQYAAFLNAAKPGAAELDSWIRLTGGAGEYFACRIQLNGGTYTVEPGYEDHPVVYVSWFGAEAYCQWAGLRLPTELEWEKGARGADGREFPWGGQGYRNGWNPDLCRCWVNGMDVGAATAGVFDYPGDESPCHLIGMAGNVGEWVLDPYQEHAYDQYAQGSLAPPTTGLCRVVRGGAWCDGKDYHFRCMIRAYAVPSLQVRQLGFRCARSL